MEMREQDPAMHDDEQDLARLLRAAGQRARPSAQAMEEVRLAVEAEWRATVAARNRRRQWTYMSAAASVAVAAVALWIARPLYLATGAPIASVARVEGTVQFREGTDAPWQRVAAASQLRADTELQTAADGRVAIELANGVDLRMDSGTRLALNGPGRASLGQGAVYVDSGPGAEGRASDFTIDTGQGEVRHLGTQYEARLLDGALRVGVREGLVAVRRDGSDFVGSAGEQLVIEGTQVVRSALSPSDPQWNWTGDVIPPFDIEGRSVDAFLAWAARETGRKVVYPSADVERRAQETLLRGSVTGLTPDAAVEAVLSTTALRPSIGQDHIRIEAIAP